MSSETVETPELAIEDVSTDTLSAKCILFNDEWHTFDEVIEQIIKATKCSRDRAERHTMEVHFSGQSIVYSGQLTRCLQVSSVLEEIALRTNVEI
ncbi:MAG: ATP-dependent Clp protease adaptor ClpS [Candidatus Kapaibacterium sp.]